jgi:hypothetical protein
MVRGGSGPREANLGFVEAITRPDIDDYQAFRSGESSDQYPDWRQPALEG